MSTPLLPLRTRVVHFNEAKHGHGLGTIIGYNNIQPNAYLHEHLDEAADIAASVGMLGGFVSAFYDQVRCPYLVEWDNGYKDVYEATSLTIYDAKNPTHDPGPRIHIRAYHTKTDPSVEKTGYIRPTKSDVAFFLSLCHKVDATQATRKLSIEPFCHVMDRPQNWEHVYLVTVDNYPMAICDGLLEDHRR